MGDRRMGAPRHLLVVVLGALCLAWGCGRTGTFGAGQTGGSTGSTSTSGPTTIDPDAGEVGPSPATSDSLDSSGVTSDSGVDSSGVTSDSGVDSSGVTSDSGVDSSGVTSDSGVDSSGVTSDSGVDSSTSVSDSSTGADTGTTTGGVQGDCCEVQTEPGCNDPNIEACVCQLDLFCCSTSWDEICVGLVEGLSCGVCRGPSCDCCEACGLPGCDVQSVENCVCQYQPSCCSVEWTQNCVNMVDMLDCGFCSGNKKGECCDSNWTPGCTDPNIEDCVCQQDPFCCDTLWNGICVYQIKLLGCGSCSGPPPPTTGDPTAGEECDDCMADQCAAELAACEADWECYCVLQCIAGGKGGGECKNECGLEYYPPQMSTLANCIVDNCLPPC